MSKPKTSGPIKNYLLSALPVDEYKRLQPSLETIELPQERILYYPEEAIQHVYFPNTAAISLLSLSEDDQTVEVGLIGREGMLGISLVLGDETTPYQSLVQIPGTAERMSAITLKRELKQSEIFNRLLLRYAKALIIQLTQSGVCNRFHKVEARLSRWLLATQDRVKSERLEYTQEILAHMLGTNRTDVTRAAKFLRQKGVINYGRGQITIVDRPGLEALACYCYQVVKKEFDRLLGS